MQLHDTVSLVLYTHDLSPHSPYLDALQILIQARRKQPQDRQLAIRHAQLLETTRQIPLAIHTYKQLINDKPEVQEADLVIGLPRCMLKTPQYEQAAKLFSQVPEKLPKPPEILVGPASCPTPQANGKQPS